MANIVKTDEHIKITMDDYDKEDYAKAQCIMGIEHIYHNDMTNKDLYIETVADGSYVLDYNTQKAYSLGSYLVQNPLKLILDTLVETGEYILYPCSAEDSAELFAILNTEDEDEEDEEEDEYETI